MAHKVSSIKMAGFRGAVSASEITFDATKTVTLIFGENGTGKSTIADAFDFVCNKSVGSLENYSLGTKPHKYLAALGKRPADVKVTLAAPGKKWEATLATAGPVVIPAADCPEARILRRKSILKLIEAQPKERFETLKTFITVPNIDKCEAALRVAERAAEDAVNETARALSQANEALQKLWEAEGKPGESALEWAKQESEKDVSQLAASVSVVDSLLPVFQPVEGAMSAIDRAIADSHEAVTAHAESEKKQQVAEAKQTQQSAAVLALLQSAKEFVAKQTALTSCPVCEQGVDSTALLKGLSDRINSMQELSKVVTATKTTQRNLETKKTLLEQSRKSFCEAARKLATALKASTLAEVTSLAVNWESFAELLTPDNSSEAAEQQARQLWLVLPDCRTALHSRRSRDQQSVTLHNAIKGHVQSIHEKTQNAVPQDVLRKQLHLALEIVSAKRKEYVEEILTKIAGEVATLYAKLHPDEPIGEVRFYLKPNAIGSLEFDAKFHSTSDLPPQAYYSESHLDTLGICVFMALSKHFRKPSTIVILDDVLTSVDGPHLERFMTMLHEEAKHFAQVIVTTHYRPWRDRYRWAKGPAGNTQVIELGPWTLQDGLQTGDFLTALDELKGVIAQTSFDRQAGASKAGIILESLMDFITLKFRSLLPRNARNEYTLGDLANGVDKTLAKVLRCLKRVNAEATRTEVLLKPLIEEATKSQWIRNGVGCHFNAMSGTVTDSEVLDFCRSVVALADVLICVGCKTLPTRRPSGSNWECRCGLTEMHPLIYPGAEPHTVDDEE